MKKILFSILSVLILSLTAQAAPFVRTDITTTNLTATNINSSGTATLANINSSGTATLAITNAAPVGVVTMFAGSSAPATWLLCDGSAVSRTTYAALFTVIGTTYGAGNGSTTFNVPDFRGVFPKGAGTTNRAAGVDANGNYYAGTLGTYSQDKMQGHIHKTYHYFTAGGVTERSKGSYNGSDEQAFSTSTPQSDGINGTPRTGLTTEPQSLGINFIIKY